ncbi:MAG: class I SAM-dependent methyltransferase [Myxococcales bacterium]|nr:class I SAM-dependent methyltransferase [Polyangiaceae bacterium]MDW8251706.1 class I SAM-dependent methyltransferase [Myxococcales bacterium]
MNAKAFLRKTFPGLVRVYRRVVDYAEHDRKLRGLTVDQVFTQIYHENHWGSTVSVSGPGSTLEQTAALREALPLLFSTYKIKRLLDVPCGDFHWMQHTDRSALDTYHGGDIVEPLIKENQARFQGEKTTFSRLDLLQDPLPDADLLLCRDCLVHLSYRDIAAAISNIRRSRIRYLLTTTFNRHENRDIVTGAWRPINLQAPPFSFPDPLLLINERCSDNDGEYGDKYAALWSVAQIPSRLAA